MHLTATPMGSPPPVAAMDFHSVEDLAAVREFVCSQAQQVGLSDDRIPALRLAVCEVATNTLQHTSSGGIARVWSEDCKVITEVTDFGSLPSRKTRRTDQTEVPGGWGLRIATEICDAFHCFSQPGQTVWRLVLNR
ncbi:ATP-binding protein [Catellatospora vulcania]|uniref:ATP-binding protein n=1 Tax=Catellatospora vulcania TaxID=1460450 RepID=UPI0012D4174E|nr:ATP-binding protein [Catellatospora vulcania]